MSQTRTITEILAAKLAIAEVATKGPWDHIGGTMTHALFQKGNMIADPIVAHDVQVEYGYNGKRYKSGIVNYQDVKFIADARTTTPALIRALQRIATIMQEHLKFKTEETLCSECQCQLCDTMRPIFANLARELEGK